MAMFRSRATEWRAARAFVEGFCGDAAVPRETCLRACLVLEELFVNTVKHGHAGGSDAPVWIALAGDGARLTVTYEDFAPPFNPLSRERREALEALANRREGGLGVILTQGLTTNTDYAYLFGRNRIHLTLR
jgi:anti-sigma regulatory factor (Ser/Thr protein kinase)